MWNYAGLSDSGCCEPINDDRLLCGTEILSEGLCSGQSTSLYCAAVFDGVGGMAEGFRAAQCAAESLRECNIPGLTRFDIRNAVETANTRILEEQLLYHMPDGMRTTVAGIYADGENFFIFNAGDSRVYQFREQHIRQLTKDHSFVQDLVDLGEITPEEARNHPKKNIIFKCLGHEENVMPRIMDMSGSFLDGDVLLLCSDGISDVLTEEELCRILADTDNLSECCTALKDAALQNNSQDNMSVLLIQKKGE